MSTAKSGDTFAQLATQFGNNDLIFALGRMDAAALAYRPDDPATGTELHTAARWYGLITRQAELLEEFREFEEGGV